MRPYDKVLLLTGVLAILSRTPFAVVVGALMLVFSGMFAPIVLIQIAVFLYMPVIFAALLAGRLIARAVPRIHPCVFALPLGVFLVMVPTLLNKWSDARENERQAGDLFEPIDLQPGDTVALVTWQDFKETTSPCHGLCLGLLLDGSASSFSVHLFDAGTDGAAPSLRFEDIGPDLPVTRFWIEKRAECPAVALSRGEGVPLTFSSMGQNYRPDSVMQRHIELGNCLMSEPGRLGDADLAIIDYVDRAPWEPGFAQVERLAAVRFGPDGMHETYRYTGVERSRVSLPALLAIPDLFSNSFMRDDYREMPKTIGGFLYRSGIRGRTDEDVLPPSGHSVQGVP